MPYSFREFGRALQSLDLDKTQLFDLYLIWGGFPLVVNMLKNNLTGTSSDMISALYNIYMDVVKIDCFPLLLPSGEMLKVKSIARNLFSQSPNIKILEALEKVDMIRIKENQHQCLCIDTGLYNAVKKKLTITEVDTEHKNLLQVAFWFLYNNFSTEVCIRNNLMKVNGKYYF